MGNPLITGAFHLFVPSGAYYVDGLLASDYLDYIRLKPVWAAGRYYVAARFYAGLPIVTHGVVDVFKVTAAAAALPAPVQLAAAPLLFVATVALELVNLAAGRALHAAAGLALLGLGCLCSRRAGKAA